MNISFISFQDLCNAIESAGYKPRSYSGRGMYGKRCLGVTCNNTSNVVLDILPELLIGGIDDADVPSEFIEEACELLRNARTDSMGRGAIIYWPEIEWEESEDE